MNKRAKFKVGGTFKPTIVYAPTEGRAPTDLSGVTIKSQIRTTDGDLIADLVVTKLSGNLSFSVTAADGTTSWPVDTCVEWDLLFEDATFGKFYSETVDLQLQRAATRATA